MKRGIAVAAQVTGGDVDAEPVVRVLRALGGDERQRPAYEGVDEAGEPVEVWRLEERETALARRISRLLHLVHPAVLAVRSVRSRDESPHVVLAALGTSLEEDPARVGSVADVRSLVRDLAEALVEGHRLGVVHGSISRRDVGFSEGRFVLDLTGLRSEHGEWVKRAPELTRDRAPTEAADLWSLGHLAADYLEEFRDDRDAELDATVAALLASDPEARPSAREVLVRLAASEEATLDDVTEIAPGVPRFLGPYRLLEAIGAGGMGSVYKAMAANEVTGGEDYVAVKLLGRQHANDPTAVRRFRREARLLAQLDTPHIARFIAAHEDRGTHYLVMELAPGKSARAHLRELGQLPIPDAISIAADVARALEDVHALGLIHRDVKPSNVLVELRSDAPPLVKLCDFGLARTTDGRPSLAEDAAQVTRMGGTPGTPSFMAPEQIQGLPLDASVDVYALGATLYTLVVGHPPYLGPPPNVLVAHVSSPVPDPREERPELGAEVAAVIMRAMAKDPAERQADAGELLRELEEAARGEAGTVDSLPRHDRKQKPLVYDFHWELASAPGELWPHVSNTERLNRAIGLDDVDWQRASASPGDVRTMGQFKAAGMTLRWKENPFEWVAPRRLGVLREYESGPFLWMRSVVDLERKEEGGTRLGHRIEIAPRNALGRAAAAVEVGVKARRGLGRVYRRIDAVAQARRDSESRRGSVRGGLLDPFEPPAKLQRTRDRRLDAAIVGLVAEGGDAEVAEHLADYLRHASPQAIGRIRPIPWARERGLDPDVVLTTFLYASTMGILTFLWDILCPACRIPATIEESLEALKEHGHCDACDLDFELDLARSVELVFRSHDDVRPADLGVYCIGGPGHSPHVLAQVRLPRGERFTLSLGLDEGVYQITGRRLSEPHRFRVHASAPLRVWDLPLREGLAAAIPRSLAPDGQEITLTNDLEHDVVVRVERVGDRADAVTAADAACHPLFRRLFPGELLSPSQLVGMSSVALLLVELADEGALEGDSDRAGYRDLMTLQQAVTDAAGSEGGALVKLHGAGVLAVFTGRVAALRAGLSVMRRADRPLRAAVHAGATMMTTINQRLDYFGRTVHVAGHLLANASPGELVLSEDVAAVPGATRLVRDNADVLGVVAAPDGTLAHRVAFARRPDAPRNRGFSVDG